MNQPTKIEILPEDLDKAVAECEKNGKWDSCFCLIAQTGMRVCNRTDIVGASYNSVIFSCDDVLELEGAHGYILQFDDATKDANKGAIDRIALVALRAQLPANVTPKA